MKKNNLKKLISACAVLTLSATAALSVIPFAACSDEATSAKQPDKLITEDKTHTATKVSTAKGEIRTEASGTVYYVAPEGDRANDGLSWDNPKSIYDLLIDENTLKPGDTVYVKPGTYSITSTVTMPAQVSGSYNKYIRIVNAALEKESGYKGTEKLATLDFSSQYFASTARGVQLYGNYIYWYGIDVCGAGDNGLYIGGSYNTVEYCEFYNNRDTGLQLGRSEASITSVENWPSYNLVKNCTSHNNYDNETFGENADGFAAKLTVGYGNVFDGCIAYRNSDDGWDLYAKSDSGNIGCVIIYNCVAFENGYIEYTQAENNARFPNYNNTFDEVFAEGDIVRYFRTRDGDGNGFKLGGSAMEGDVIMYNCLSYFNRMHGVTDNSNPGYLKVEGVTSYDNSAVVDENPDSPTFGEIIPGEVNYNQDTHGNVDVSRQTYSYNTVKNTLSVKSGYASYLEHDAYRGSVTDSVLYGAAQNYIVGSMDADSKNGISNTETKSLLKAENVFKALPLYKTTNGEETKVNYNLSGLHDLYASGTSGALKADRVHVSYRNEDGSINMHDILAKKDGVDDSLLIAGKDIGSTLNKNGWDDYTHFFIDDYVNAEAAKEDIAKVERAYETLSINCDPAAVYQDFEVPLLMKDVKINWTVSNSEVLEFNEDDIEISISGSQYMTVLVNRPLSQDVKVTLTANIKCGEAVKDKVFELTVKAGQPIIGNIYVLTDDGTVLNDGASYVLDQYMVYNEPEIKVQNGLDYNGKLLTTEQYEYETTYMYASDKNSPFVQVAGFTPSNAGVYMITHTVTLKSDGSKGSMTYTLFTSSSAANVTFITGTDTVVVNRDGYLISGDLSNATGYIYAVSTASGVAPTKDTIKNYEGVKYYSYRNDSISFQFENDNSGAYKVYYALANLNGEITSEVFEKSISVTEISTTADFIKIAGGNLIGDEIPENTIYQLTTDLDFNGVTYPKHSKAFTGLFNGAGHTIKNITVSGSGDVGVFYRVTGGTVENVKFENVSINNPTNSRSGIIASVYGGYFHNIALKNVNINGGERTGGFIGQAYEGLTYISQVSLVNDADHEITSGISHRAAGILGFIQPSSGIPVGGKIYVYISDCYVKSAVSGTQQIGGIVGSYDNQNGIADYLLEISHCYFGGTASSTYATPRVGGLIGYQPGAIGKLVIDGCISVGKLYNQGNLIEASLKTASLIFGGYSSTAVNTVTNCISLMEEYNSDYQVDAYSVENLKSSIAAIENILGEGFEKKWSFVYSENNANRLEEPFLTLNFLN